MTLPHDLSELMRLSGLATPGEWCAFLQGTTGDVVDDAVHAEPGHCCEGGGDIVCLEPGAQDFTESQKYWEANAQFIAAACNFARTYGPRIGELVADAERWKTLIKNLPGSGMPTEEWLLWFVERKATGDAMPTPGAKGEG